MFWAASWVLLGCAGTAGASERKLDIPADFEYRVSGIEKPAEIIVDYWGIPHIYANTHYDAFFAAIEQLYATTDFN